MSDTMMIQAKYKTNFNPTINYPVIKGRDTTVLWITKALLAGIFHTARVSIQLIRKMIALIFVFQTFKFGVENQFNTSTGFITLAAFRRKTYFVGIVTVNHRIVGVGAVTVPAILYAGNAIDFGSILVKD